MADNTPLTASGITQAQAGGSLASAIGLQGIVKQDSSLYLAQLRSKQLAEEKAREKRATAIEKWGKDLDIKGVHRLDIDEAKGIFAETIQDLVQNYDTYTPTQKELRLNEGQAKIQLLQERAKNLENSETALRRIVATRDNGWEEAQKMTTAMETKDWQGVQDASDNIFGITKGDAINKTVAVHGFLNINLPETERKTVDRREYKTTPVLDENGKPKIIKRPITDIDGKIIGYQDENEMGVGDKDITNLAFDLLNNEPNYRASKEYSLVKSGQLNKNDNYLQLRNSNDQQDIAKANDLLQKAVEEDMKKKAGVRFVSIKRITPSEKGKLIFNLGGSSTVGNLSFGNTKDDDVALNAAANNFENNPAYIKYKETNPTGQSAKDFMEEAFKKFGGATGAETIVFTKTDAPIGSPAGFLGEDKGYANSISLIDGKWKINVTRMIKPSQTVKGVTSLPVFAKEQIPFKGEDRKKVEGEFTFKGEGLAEYIKEYNKARGRDEDYGMWEKETVEKPAKKIIKGSPVERARKMKALFGSK